jgi:hypothetical protein
MQDERRRPQAYLADIPARIADHPIQRIDELLPGGWKTPPSRQTADFRRSTTGGRCVVSAYAIVTPAGMTRVDLAADLATFTTYSLPVSRRTNNQDGWRVDCHAEARAGPGRRWPAGTVAGPLKRSPVVRRSPHSPRLWLQSFILFIGSPLPPSHRAGRSLHLMGCTGIGEQVDIQGKRQICRP